MSERPQEDGGVWGSYVAYLSQLEAKCDAPPDRRVPVRSERGADLPPRVDDGTVDPPGTLPAEYLRGWNDCMHDHADYWQARAEEAEAKYAALLAELEHTRERVRDLERAIAFHGGATAVRRAEAAEAELEHTQAENEANERRIAAVLDAAQAECDRLSCLYGDAVGLLARSRPSIEGSLNRAREACQTGTVLLRAQLLVDLDDFLAPTPARIDALLAAVPSTPEGTE